MSTATVWYPPPSDVRIKHDEVHVWRAGLDIPAAQLAGLRETLAGDEVTRAERFFFERDRAHFVAARGMLRALLSRYVGMAPHDLHFAYGARGKPALINQAGQLDVRFNLAHSHGRALYAIATGREVGVDLEYIRADVAGEQIAQRFFAPQEYAALQMLPASERQRAFFACWTRKEAYIKARGDGLAHALDQFAVSMTPDPAVTLTATGVAAQEVARWSLHGLGVAVDYAAALAVEGHEWQLRCWDWDGE